MMLKKLVLDNWKSFENRELIFTEGINLFEGDNYAGKSSLIQALYYIFFGKTLFKALTAKELKREGENEATITLDFSVNDKTYRIRRNIKGDNRVTTSSYLYLLNEKGEEDDEIETFSQGLSGKQKNFTKLEAILESSLKYMENVNFVLEESIHDFLSAPNYKINEDLNSILQLDYLNKISGYCEATVKDLSKEIKSLEDKSKEYSSKFEEIKHARDNNKENIDEKGLQNKGIEEELVFLNEKQAKITEFQKFGQELTELDSRKEEIDDDLLEQKQELEELQASLDDISRKEVRFEELKKKLEILVKNKKGIEVLESELAPIQEKLKNIDKDIAILQDRKKNLVDLQRKEKELKEKLKPIEKIKNEIENLEIEQKKFEEHQKSINLLNDDINKSKEIIKNFQTGTCPISQEKCPVSQELIKNQEQKLAGLEKQVSVLKSTSGALTDESIKIQDIKDKLKKANPIKMDLRSVSKQIKELEPKIEDLKEKQDIKSDLETKIQDINDKIGMYKEANGKLEKENKEFIQLEVEIKNKQKIIADIEKRKETLVNKNKEKEEIQEEIESLNKNIEKFKETHELDDENKIASSIEKLEETLSKNKEEIKDLQKELERMKVSLDKILHPYTSESELQEALENQVHLSAKYDFFKDTIALTLTALSTRKFREIKEACNKMWATFKEHSGMDSIDWDDKFIPSVKIGGNERTIYQLSASEKIMIYFSVRSALLANLGPHYFIIVDNLLAPFMKDKQKIILGLLKDILANTDIKQIIFTGFDIDSEFKCNNRVKI